jgi:hypothetical protein
MCQWLIDASCWQPVWLISRVLQHRTYPLSPGPIKHLTRKELVSRISWTPTQYLPSIQPLAMPNPAISSHSSSRMHSQSMCPNSSMFLLPLVFSYTMEGIFHMVPFHQSSFRLTRPLGMSKVPTPFIVHSHGNYLRLSHFLTVPTRGLIV